MKSLLPSDWLERLLRSTFRRQLTIAVGVGVLLAGSLSAWLSSWQSSLQARETLQAQGLNLAHSLAQQSQLALLTQGGDNARAALDRAFSYPDVQRVELLYPDGVVLIARGNAPAQAASRPRAQASAAYLEAESGDYWSFVAPVLTQPSEASPFDGEPARSELLGYVRVTQGKAALADLVRRLIFINFGVGLASAVVLIWVLRQLALRLSRPLGELSEVMARAGDGALAARARPYGPKDLVRMAEVFNRMMDTLEQRDKELQHKNDQLAAHAETLERRVAERTASLSTANQELHQALDALTQAQNHLVETEKLASLGRLVAGVAHELNTPLGNALMAATTLEEQQQKLARAMTEGSLRRSDLERGLQEGVDTSSLVTRNVQRAAEIISGFKQLAVDQTTDKRRAFKADEVLREVLTTLHPMFKRTPFQVIAHLEPNLRMDSYPGPLGQVITNIAQNALIHAFAGRDGGEFRVECRPWGDHHVQIVCSDDGNGMEEAVRKRVFEAFFTTKFGQGGSGLGMQIVHTLVTGLLGGRIAVDSAPGLGTQVIVTLPRTAPETPHEG
ncbi:sensor histidine kinase [Inhella gelatinilytica]|uniref:histidine kinase n=1 Tax=Inhella gelatinilytica TaxID=2795030 RepID=A0A931NE19_9BURK|nr:ATP-binding protein [Inhella gelatinilytica]MBH9552815.1 HAMP domain-containing protein [Inhella gelatinilytica]